MALVLSILIAASAFVIWPQYVGTSDRARHLTEVISDLNDLVNDLFDAESSARGFLLSGDEQILRHFTAASLAAEAMRRELSKSTADFAGHESLLNDLEAAADQKLQSLDSAIGAARLDKNARTAPAKAVQRDEALIARIRQLDFQTEQHLQRSLQAIRDRGRFLVRLSQLISALGCVGIFAIVLLSDLRIQRLGTARLRLNNELALTNEDLRQFVYSASHDMQEPLRLLMLYSELIERNIQGQRAVTSELGHLRAAAKQMRELVIGLLSYTEVIGGAKVGNDSSDLNLIAQKAIESLRSAADETKAEFSIGDLPVVLMAESHAQILLENLFSNSLKYRKENLTPRIAISAVNSAGKWVISVADNGIGVEPAYHQLIFGIFKRLHTRAVYPGTGLGVAICRRIVERYGGAIWVESAPGGGSIFRFSTPGRTALREGLSNDTRSVLNRAASQGSHERQ